MLVHHITTIYSLSIEFHTHPLPGTWLSYASNTLRASWGTCVCVSMNPLVSSSNILACITNACACVRMGVSTPDIVRLSAIFPRCTSAPSPIIREELRRWLLSQEATLFRHRFRAEGPESQVGGWMGRQAVRWVGIYAGKQKHR